MIAYFDYSSRAASSVRGLHCTWLVPRTRASSDGLDDLDSGEWIHLKRGIDHGGCGPIDLRGHLKSQEGLDTEVGPKADLIDLGQTGTYSLVPRGTQIPYSAAVNLVVGLGVSHLLTPNHPFVIYTHLKGPIFLICKQNWCTTRICTQTDISSTFKVVRGNTLEGEDVDRKGTIIL
ncbi:hypothetical protein M9H77_02147 [Catharanthus roseus]|uniref:Uncharacterized protein n=1 Tax=Catharanthus roseus TaxID=4058 RepID=A0ACC0C7Q4_CATRO|nr:hypothetical protein M9H77_02147 [Catharanthus roseus]